MADFGLERVVGFRVERVAGFGRNRWQGLDRNVWWFRGGIRTEASEDLVRHCMTAFEGMDAQENVLH